MAESWQDKALEQAARQSQPFSAGIAGPRLILGKIHKVAVRSTEWATMYDVVMLGPEWEPVDLQAEIGHTRSVHPVVKDCALQNGTSALSVGTAVVVMMKNDGINGSRRVVEVDTTDGSTYDTVTMGRGGDIIAGAGGGGGGLDWGVFVD